MKIKEKVSALYKRHFEKRVSKILDTHSDNDTLKKELSEKISLLSLNLTVALELNNDDNADKIIREFSEYLTKIEKGVN